jgi:HD-GYP domain-containing protein (c-di-GMP phosphodiesterase class II)
LRRRAGLWFDPGLVGAFETVASSDAFWASLASPLLPAMVVALAPPDDELAVDDDYLDTIAAAFGQVIDAKSPFTSGHSRRVADFAFALGEKMGLDAARARTLRRAAFLHDVGKLGVSSAVLEKPASLDEREWVEMRDHAEHTRAILGRIAAFEGLADMAAAHHERLDGRGYPKRLSGSDIALETRIITVCDFYDALTADRPYRAAMAPDRAFALMAESDGSGIDPDCFALLKAEVGG